MDNQLYYQYQIFRHQLSKLQAHKSSFQAWKCVSFGYALLATVLLSAKWHEVSTDLRLLNGIDQLLWQTTAANSSAPDDGPIGVAAPFQRGAAINRTSGGHLHPNSAGMTRPDEWGPEPAVLAMELVVAANQSSSENGNEPTNGSSTAVLMSHMQMSLGRELNGNQLLKQEVETFLAEFRSAKSTLTLSSLLVFVYIISWILMTLAVNDTRISNDISLRNILLLSVFGAIDMAASVGFVMVRMIMFNVKSNTFMVDILGLTNLREAPVRLSSDQLTAFTALRLIAMRSCSAYVDIYVSVLVALLTVLRLYAIIRAIAYYRFLRRFNDLTRNLHHHHQLTAAIMNQTSEKQHFSTGTEHLQHYNYNQQKLHHHPHPLHHQQQQQQQQQHQATTTLQGFVSQTGAGADLMRAPSHQWSTTPKQQHQRHDSSGPATASTGLTLSSASTASGNNQTGQQEQQQQQHQLTGDQEEKQQMGCQPEQSKLFSSDRKTMLDGKQTSDANKQLNYLDQQQQQQQQKMTFNEAIRFGAKLFETNQQQASEEQQFQLVNRTIQSPTNLMVQTDDRQAAIKTLIKVASFGGQRQQHQQQHIVSTRPTTNQRSPLFVLSNDLETQLGSEWPPASHADEASKATISNKRQHDPSSGAPNILMVNGRPHELIATTTSNEFARRKRHGLGYESSGGAGFESEPVAMGTAEARRDYIEMRSRSRQRQRSHGRDPGHLLLAAAGHPMPDINDSNNNNIGQKIISHGGSIGAAAATNNKQHSSFTLLSASQLDKLSRKLLANATGSLALGGGGGTAGPNRGRRQQLLDRAQSSYDEGEPAASTLGGNKYKLIARYRPVKRQATASSDGRQQQQQSLANGVGLMMSRSSDYDQRDQNDLMARQPQPQAYEHAARRHRLADLLDDSTSGASSSSSGATDSDEAPTTRVVTTPEGGPKLEALTAGRRHRRQEPAARLIGRSTDAKVSGSGGGGQRRQRARASLGSLRLTEELSLEPAAETNANRDLLLGKYYYT
uniref:Uncharacterized protein n=1 Tax=Aceria tosichella TaxID=561515 RepID=A0A6G1S4B3_9ACAR